MHFYIYFNFPRSVQIGCKRIKIYPSYSTYYTWKWWKLLTSSMDIILNISTDVTNQCDSKKTLWWQSLTYMETFYSVCLVVLLSFSLVYSFFTLCCLKLSLFNVYSYSFFFLLLFTQLTCFKFTLTLALKHIMIQLSLQKSMLYTGLHDIFKIHFFHNTVFYDKKTVHSILNLVYRTYMCVCHAQLFWKSACRLK